MKKVLRVLLFATLLNYPLMLFAQGWMTSLIDGSDEELIQKVPHDYKGNVIIIGAGAAGLAAANLLQKNNVEFTILEATNRYGGRVRKNSHFADFPIDLGAEWIHHEQSILNRLIGQSSHKAPPVELILYNPTDAYSWDGSSYEKTNSALTKFAQSSFPEYKFKKTTWYDFLKRNFAKNVIQKIVFNSPVTKVNYLEEKVIITTLNGREFKADKVISTVSIGVLKAQKITFIPPLAPNKIKSFESVDFLPGFKLFIKFSNQFYPDIIEVDTDSGEKTYYDVAYKKDTAENILGLLSTGESAEEYYKLNDKALIVETVIAELDKIFDGQASTSYYGEYLYKDWGRAQFTLGTWTDDYTDGELKELLAFPLQDKVYFAGETFDQTGQSSTVPGAIISGYAAVYQLLDQYRTVEAQ